MSKNNLNSKTKWSLIGGGAVLVASLAIGLGVHFGTQSESESPTDVFVREMSKVSEENIDTENKETIINDKEYELIEDNKIFCGGTDQADAQTKLKAFHDAYQLEQTFFIKPHSIVSTKGITKMFSHYRGETNVEKNCWEVEVPKFPTGTRSNPTEAEGRLVATIILNIEKRRYVDKNSYKSNNDILQLIKDSGVYCSNQVFTFIQASNYFKRLLNDYEVIKGDADTAPLTFTGNYEYVDGKVSSVKVNCWRAIPKTTEAT